MTAPQKPLIDAAGLASRLADPDLVILDCRHQLSDPDAGERSYGHGHIPGARHAHMDRDLSRPPKPNEGRHPLPSPAIFAQTLQRLGVSGQSSVVVYDDCGGIMAARLWWMLRWAGHTQVSVLDGGLAAWSAAGLVSERDSPPPRQGSFAPSRVRDDWVVDTAELPALLGDGCNVLVDARTVERFQGIAEPIDPVAGHIPGAKNLPIDQLLTHTGEFADAKLLRQRFAEAAGEHRAGDVIAMCGSGVTACHLLLGMEAAGLGTGRLYAGSWSEWIRDPTRPIASIPRG